MHFVISSTWGPTDPTRAMLPFIFAASAVQDGDRVTLMLFHDAVLVAMDGAGAKRVPVGPPNRYEEVASHPNVIVWACRPCVDARGLALRQLPTQPRRSKAWFRFSEAVVHDWGADCGSPLAGVARRLQTGHPSRD